MSTTKRPSIPAVPNDVTPALKRFFEAMKESIEVWDGKRGNDLDKVITVRDLIGSGMAKVRRYESGLSVDDGAAFEGVANIDFSVPPPLLNLTASGAFAAVFLSWDQVVYSNLSHVEIWRAAKNEQADDNFGNDIGKAVLVGSTSANVFMDYVAGSSAYFYWVRPVTTANVTGPFNATVGTEAQTNDDPSYILGVLNDSISESQLAESLESRIDLIDGTMPGSVSARILTEQQERVEGDTALAESVTTLQTVVGENSASIQQSALAIDGLSAQYSIKIDVNGYVAGYGLAVESSDAGQSSLFLVNADRFAIAHPNATGGAIPFIVDGGKVYLDTAVIKNASITSAQIDEVAANKISAGTVNVALTLNAAHINGGSLNINNRFIVNSQGSATIRSGTSGARLELVNNVIRVYDANGRLRVKIGNLA